MPVGVERMINLMDNLITDDIAEMRTDPHGGRWRTHRRYHVRDHRARRDADMTAAMIAEEYKLNSLLSQWPRLVCVQRHRGRGFRHFEHRSRRVHAQVRRQRHHVPGVLQVLSTRLQEEQAPPNC